MTETETIALLSQIIAETAEELGCENDNEAILQAIHDLKQRPTLPSPPVSGEAVKLPRKFNPNHGWAHAMQADEPAFLLRYDDPERQDVTFTGYGAEEAALKMWEVANNSWNCALFKTMRTSPITNEPVGVTETWQTACDWLETTFGPIRPERIITRAKEEFEELESAENIEQQTIEAADVVMCLMRFPGLWEALVAKMAVNRARTWELRGDGTGYHVKGLSASITGEPQ